ncbi:MAG: hypothetical protein NC187_06935 [Candidatus Amulumruptor caecigallinarius]|nr:hypothetical protein [Candidatus Amulumruptor caecigallinarius]MCM1397203.1 hypothetical protein [Candidatus Amulumruptor caecigallinarius]MCM1453108.1 hypothetical protein [bacterium]
MPQLADRIAALVREYIENEELYSDNVQLAINPSSLDLEIADPDDDLPELDYYPMMDLVAADTANPGRWVADVDAIEEVAAEYVTTR